MRRHTMEAPRNSTEEKHGEAATLTAQACQRRLPAQPEVIQGAPGSRLRKRSPGAPWIQPALWGHNLRDASAHSVSPWWVSGSQVETP